jgi:cytochrome c oxidase assembly factor CtaG
VLILVAAPLLALSAPLLSLLWALPRSWCRRLAKVQRTPPARIGWRIVTNPLVVWVLHLGALVIWHMPSLYEAALHSEIVHALEHASFFGTALLFWRVVVDPSQRLSYGAGVLYVFATAIPGGVLAALITLARTPWYPSYSNTAAAWGLTPLEDQQLAGMLMWMPASVIYVLAALALFAAWLRHIERCDQALAAVTAAREGEVS